ncbi:hypothetical protein MMC07_005675 [Pseudocyphellaria aurata]|nr:hypothetical protein [Pseudocyphellaria aurata]
MHFVTILASVALSLNLVVATPVAATTTPITKASNLVRFKTRVHPGQDTSKNGLYLSCYRIGAAFYDVVFGKEPAVGVKGFINNGTLQFDLGTDFPLYLRLGSINPYDEWFSVWMVPGSPTEGFAIKDRKLVCNGSAFGDWFNGWLVCDWYHDMPQLFWKATWSQNVTTSNCASVDLVTEKA